MDIFRNRDGTAEKKNEYILHTNYGLFGCSVRD